MPNQIFKHFLNGVEIKEPKGFDNFKIKLERSDHHGIEETDALNPDTGRGFQLEFWDKYPRELIMSALREDIERDILYEYFYAPDSKTPLELIYSAYIDLVNVSIKHYPYCSVLCSLRPSSEIINFYNRKNTTVDLRRQERDLSGNLITGYSGGKEIEIPSKAIRLTNKYTQTNGDEIIVSLGQELSSGFAIGAGFDTKNLNEISADSSGYSFSRNIHSNNIGNLFLNTSSETGNVHSFSLKVAFDFRLAFIGIEKATYHTVLRMFIKDEHPLDLITTEHVELQLINSGIRGGAVDVSVSVVPQSGFPRIEKIERISLITIVNTSEAFSQTGWLRVTPSTENFIKIQVDTQKPASHSNLILVHEALSKLSEISSGTTDGKTLTVKSDWYGRSDSDKNQLPFRPPTPVAFPQFGGGALKGFLSGFELRNAYLPDGETQPSVQISFKDLYNSLNAIDNIGYGSEKGENGQNFIRVERWQWFYNSEVILEINHPKIDDNVVNGNFWSRLKTGYSKHIEDTEFNAVDSFYGEQERTTGVGMESELNMVSDLIADPYAIELTRRQQFNENGVEVQTTKNWKYDNDNFVLALENMYDTFIPIEANRYVYNVDVGVENSEGTIISPETFTNFRISPMRNATRWTERFFEIASNKNEFEFTSGIGNTTAKGSPMTKIGDGLKTYSYLQDSVNGIAMSENQAIPKRPPLLQDDVLVFDYPIKYVQYKAIRANPHGIIRINGEDWYLKEFEYCFAKPLGRFQVVRKA